MRKFLPYLFLNFCLAFFIVLPQVNAASYNFSYSYDGPNRILTLSGMLEGDARLSDPNIIDVTSITMMEYIDLDNFAQIPLPLTPILGSQISIDGSSMLIFVGSSGGARVFFDSSNKQAELFLTGGGAPIQSVLYNPAFWSLTEKQTSQIPEPTTLLIMSTGLLGLAGYRWHQRRRGGTQIS